MTININPNRINVSSGGTDKTSESKRQQDASGNVFVVPKRADLNNIPAPESLMTLIRSAVEALRQGIRWDRGTILNILV